MADDRRSMEGNMLIIMEPAVWSEEAEAKYPATRQMAQNRARVNAMVEMVKRGNGVAICAPHVHSEECRDEASRMIDCNEGGAYRPVADASKLLAQDVFAGVNRDRLRAEQIELRRLVPHTL